MSSGDTQSYSVLSERELQIVELVASGLTNQDIADMLEISKRTVDNHISNILQKTGTGNRVALFRWALNWGKICIDEVNCCRLPEPGETPGAKPSQVYGQDSSNEAQSAGGSTPRSNFQPSVHSSSLQGSKLQGRGLDNRSQAS